MATETLGNRIANVENDLSQIKRQLAMDKPEMTTGWEKMFGIFADSEGFKEATRLGREYREAQRPDDDAETT